MLDQFSEIIYFVKGVIRNKWIITIAAWFICIGGWYYVYQMPDIYKSSARVHVDTRSMLRPLLRGLAVQSNVRGMVLIMKKLMFTRNNMIKVAEVAGMEVDLTSDAKVNSLVDKLKGKVKISGGRDEIFTISHESEDPQTAKDVVQAVLTVFSEQTQQSSISDMDTAQRFIDSQIREHEQRLRNAEKARENFKRTNIGLLPGSGSSGQISVIQGLRKKVEDSQMQLAEIRSRKRVLHEQLDEAIDSGDEWGLTEFLGAGSGEDPRISQLLNRKTQMLLKYTKDHPSIISIDSLIKSIEEQNAGDESGTDVEADIDLETDISTRAMSNPYVQSIKMALNKVDTEIATINSRIVSYKKKLENEDVNFNARLAIETEMKNLNRDYNTIKKNYMGLIDRREKARMSESVDTQVSALKFKIIDPAVLPIEPSSPKRKIMYSATLLVGFVVGIALALVKVFIRPTIIDTKQLRTVTGLPVLGSITEVVDAAQTKKNLYRLISYVSVNVVLLLAFSGVMILDVMS